MKKVLVLLVMVLCFLSTSVHAAVIVETKRIEPIQGRDGITYLVDENSCTISDSQHEYQFSVTESGAGQSIEITYPDGSTYWESGKEGNYTMGWSDDYLAFTAENDKGYAPGEILCEVYRSEMPKHERKNVWPCIIGFILGLFSLVKPEYAWYLQYGWRFKNAEPSDAAIMVERIVGVVLLILVGLYIMI